jgi:hypothetical protein
MVLQNGFLIGKRIIDGKVVMVKKLKIKNYGYNSET